MANHRRERSRSPTRVGNVGRRREKNSDSKNGDVSNIMNPMMMQNMYPQGNMVMGGMYTNMMMPNSMMGGTMLANGGMEMMSNTGMEMMPQGSLDMQSMSAQQIAPTTAAPAMDMSMMGGMMMDPSMMGMYSAMTGMPSEMAIVEKKEIILKHCKLTPPSAGAQEPPRRAKPPGCRTIFVGGLPDKTRETHVREIFECYGRIQTLRLSTKNFCHIRFDRENCVEAAMALSGYHLKLITGKEEDEKDDTKATTSWLHVDYALSRDDQNEYERRQRQVLRVQEEQMKQLTAQQKALAAQHTMETAPYRLSPSPVRVQPFSNAAMLQLSDKIKSEDNFSSTLPTLIAWLERGECSKKNSTQFYSMIQATNSHIRRLFNEKMQAEEELNDCKERVKTHIEKVIDQLEQVAKVFTAATHQRVWDHFTKPQRKNIETWQKMTPEFHALKEEFNDKFQSEDNEYNTYNATMVEVGNNNELQMLKRENESLQFQLEAYKNEVDVIKTDAQKEMEKFKAQFIARQALKGAFEGNPPLPQVTAKRVASPPPPKSDDVADEKVNIKSQVDVACGEAKLIGVMSAFLQVHPQGASLDYVVSYVRAMFPQVNQATVHHVLQKHTDVFECTTSGVGANIEHRWSFIAFRLNSTS